MSALDHLQRELQRYRRLGEEALARLADAQLNAIPAEGMNSAAMIARHVGGNLTSRFTDFLTTDGEKPWRDRDGEFETRAWTRADVEADWARGWAALDAALATLTAADLERTVTIRGEAMPVHHALVRASAHVAYHAGQLVLLARIPAGTAWGSLSIPRAADRP